MRMRAGRLLVQGLSVLCFFRDKFVSATKKSLFDTLNPFRNTIVKIVSNSKITLEKHSKIFREKYHSRSSQKFYLNFDTNKKSKSNMKDLTQLNSIIRF